ncbi:MAG TPA: hypothetical protein VF911_06660 [Thermoanaerobaculia bacterium]
MDFILRILFSGLIAFVPSEDGKEVTVLLLNVDHAYHTSDGGALAHHTPMVVARAGNCSGQCPKRDAAVAQALFADKSLAAAQDALEAAVGGGGGWILNGSDLTLRKGSTNAADLPALVFRNNTRASVNGVPLAIPTTSTEREDYSWIADFKKVCPSGCTLDQSVLGSNPPAGLVAARFKLRSGKVFTYSVARIGSDVTPVKFQRLDGTGSVSPYSQAVASWVAADISVSGDDIELVETKFDGTAGRSMMLEPDAEGKIELAVLNLPPFVPPTSPDNNAPAVGKHFEAYYELMQTPPASATRLVPRPGAAAGTAAFPQVDWHLVHPATVLYSELLNKLRLDVGRSVYDRTLCPPMNNNVP